ncbi:MAG: phospho-N-acetylmuramoyl-pentapeptide-transferase [Halobacteriovoraceae bacterium]|nr:phospho-N-acetylmuramoyl-pentapeptide-transferase [Halobacteriovoraceae bacterium]
MLYHFLYPFSQEIPLFNVFRYITTRSFIAFVLGTFFAILWGKKFIAFIRKKQFGQVIREEGPESHKKKGGTPTFGGILILGSMLLALLVCGNFLSYPLLCTLFVMGSYFLLGFVDDYLKILKKNTNGISARGKLVWQFLTAFIISYLLVHKGIITTELYVPFLKYPILDLGWFFYIFSGLVIVGCSNAVNLTDGLDGLAIGPIMTSLVTISVLCYVGGHAELSEYLFIPYIKDIGELVVFSAALIGASFGFLWYNTYPAQIFMGDVGSLSIGGALGVMSVISKNEVLLLIFGGIFVIEALSVIIQVASFKTRGKRVFKMAPIHHHFELKGWEEPKVIVRFWIISAVLAVLSLASLKLR